MLCWNGKLCTLAVLLVLYACTTGVYANFRRPTRVGLVCCNAVSKAPIPRNITLLGYRQQNALPPCVEAVIFFSEKEKFCSDPTARWISRRQKELQEFKD